MPELSRFYGIIIRMYAEPDAPHHKPHLHAYYQDNVAVYALDPIVLIAGSVPRRQRRLIETWVSLHQSELLENWNRLQQGRKPFLIDPLS
jgi:hypothetical protein